MPKPTLAYILPTNFDHEGIKLKVHGQLQSLNKHYTCKLISYNYKRNSFFLKKLFAYFCFELSALIAMLLQPIIYIRYNPKSIFLNDLIILLSYFKPIYLEHNVIMDSELKFLKRPFERRLHLLTLLGLRFSNCKHIALSQEIKRHLQNKGLKDVRYAQNGYLAPDYRLNKDEQSALSRCDDFIKNYDQSAIFCGNGYPWHGLNDVLDLVKTQDNTGLIIVGPYPVIDSPNCLYIPFMSSALLTTVMEHCHYGIGTFRWDLLSFTEGCPLKSRQMLCHGLPILINYYDGAADYDDLKPFVIDYRTHKAHSFDKIKEAVQKRSGLATLARQRLSWDVYFADIGLTEVRNR